ncbi:Ribulose-phosphate 3-epimerase [Buchnera aphidicola (Thelaxes suberi)]|uniref:ribulose-phosphate 3-epimerase n=1 Tax=Buchnera aphidicola TaxID=9 RepID=UPI003464DF59
MNKFLIAPSILSADFAQLGKEVKKVLKYGADMIHFDVMDNHYVPNLTIGPLVLSSLRKYGVTAPIDVHLMTIPDEELILNFIRAGADYITIHVESTVHLDKFITLIKQNGCKSGIALNPSTPLCYLDCVMHQIDLVLLMTVNPGLGGQNFITSSLKKIRATHKRLCKENKKILLQVDGGIKLTNITDVALAGANIFVIGSAIFNSNDYDKTINIFKNQLNQLYYK